MKITIFLPSGHTKWWILIDCFILNHLSTPSKSLFNHGKCILSILLTNILFRIFFALLSHGTISPYTYWVKLVWAITKGSIFPPYLLWKEQFHTDQFGIIVLCEAIWSSPFVSSKKRRVGGKGHLATYHLPPLSHSASLFLVELMLPWIFSIMSISLISPDISYLFLSRVYDFTFLSADLVLLAHSHSPALFLFQPYAFSLLPLLSTAPWLRYIVKMPIGVSEDMKYIYKIFFCFLC